MHGLMLITIIIRHRTYNFSLSLFFCATKFTSLYLFFIAGGFIYAYISPGYV